MQIKINIEIKKISDFAKVFLMVPVIQGDHLYMAGCSCSL